MNDCKVELLQIHSYSLSSSLHRSLIPAQTPDPHTLRPHAWQRVHYLPARPTVQTGQTLVLDVRLKGDELRIEADEDVPCMVLGPTGCASKPGTACGTYGLEGLPVGESLPAGEALDSEDTITAGNSSHDNDAVGGQGVGRRQHHSSGTSSSSSVHDVEEGAMGGLILPYHMSMLNDRWGGEWPMNHCIPQPGRCRHAQCGHGWAMRLATLDLPQCVSRQRLICIEHKPSHARLRRILSGVTHSAACACYLCIDPS